MSVAAEPAGVPRARMMLQRAHWAATAFAGYDRERTHCIVEAVADAQLASALNQPSQKITINAFFNDDAAGGGAALSGGAERAP